MARLDTPNNGEPFDPRDGETTKVPPPRQVVQVSDPTADLRPRIAGQPDGPGESNPPDPNAPRKRLVHPFPLGQVHDSTLEPPRQVLGQVSNPAIAGRTFEISVMGNGQPIVQSNQTANFWTISWSTLIKLALAEGIERQGKPAKPKLVDITGKQISSEDDK